jgi:hypothetical protein
MRWPLRQFLADWPLVYVDSMRWDTFRGIATISYRQMMGDHAIVPSQVTEHPSNDLEQDSLYIDSEYQWHLLRPFLVGRDCPVCKNRSTFHVDWAERALAIKSLDNEHIAEGDWLTSKDHGSLTSLPPSPLWHIPAQSLAQTQNVLSAGRPTHGAARVGGQKAIRAACLGRPLASSGHDPWWRPRTTQPRLLGCARTR